MVCPRFRWDVSVWNSWEYERVLKGQTTGAKGQKTVVVQRRFILQSRKSRGIVSFLGLPIFTQHVHFFRGRHIYQKKTIGFCTEKELWEKAKTPKSAFHLSSSEASDALYIQLKALSFSPSISIPQCLASRDYYRGHYITNPNNAL